MTSQQSDDDAWKLEIVRCPISGERLMRADCDLLERLHLLALAGGLTTRVGETVPPPLEGGMLNQCQRWFYLERSHTLLLTADEAIDLQQLPAA